MEPWDEPFDRKKVERDIEWISTQFSEKVLRLRSVSVQSTPGKARTCGPGFCFIPAVAVFIPAPPGRAPRPVLPLRRAQRIRQPRCKAVASSMRLLPNSSISPSAISMRAIAENRAAAPARLRNAPPAAVAFGAVGQPADQRPTLSMTSAWNAPMAMCASAWSGCSFSAFFQAVAESCRPALRPGLCHRDSLAVAANRIGKYQALACSGIACCACSHTPMIF